MTRPPPLVLERFRPSAVYLELDAPDALPRARYRMRAPVTCGHYDHVNGLLLAIFRRGEDLFVRVGDRAFRLDPRVRCAWRELDEDRCHFELTVGREVVLACDYRVPVDRLEAADPGFEPGQNDLPRALQGVIAAPQRWGEIYR